jgi:replicative DNA helicase
MPPANIDAERGVIGSVLLLPSCLGDVADILRPEDFYVGVNGSIFATMLALEARRQPIDALTLLEAMRNSPTSGDVDLRVHLTEAVHATPGAFNAVYYAKIVRAKSILRTLIASATETLQAAYADKAEPQAILDRAEQRLQAIGGTHESDLVTAAQVAIEVGDHIDAVCERKQHLGLPTGLPDFDERIGGLFGGELIVLAARPSVGKSALAAQIADYAGRTGRLVYFASLEMTGRELAMRTICNIANVNGQSIRNGRVTTEDRGRLVDGMASYAQRRLLLDTRGDLTTEALCRTIRRLVKDGLELAVVDYLGLLTPSDTKVKRYEQVGQQTRALKLLARETGIRLLVLCQLNRATSEESMPPQLHNLRESGSIEQDADTVIFIHRPEDGIMVPDPDDKRKKVKADWPAEVIVAKQRNGPTGRIKMDWEAKYTRFSCFRTPAYSEFSEFA